jgi:hypothetical protein
MALLANIRICWKGLTGTSTLAYYEHFLIMDVKCFITLTPEANVIKHFYGRTNFGNKLECLSLASFSNLVLQTL